MGPWKARRGPFLTPRSVGAWALYAAGVPHPLDPIFQALAQLRSDWPKRGWSWDSRLACVASNFEAEVIDKASAAVTRALPTVWSDRTMLEAPATIREIGERSGGVRAGQLIYTRAPVVHAVAYALWWPWGNGSTISLRVGIEADVDYAAKVCEIFGTEP